MGGSSYTQGTTALFSIDTPLGTDKLLLQGFKGSEGISRLFRFELDLLSEENSIDYTQIIGKSVTITLNQSGGTPRYFNGIVSRFGQGSSNGTITSYQAEMVPWLWLLTRATDCKIFQSMTVMEIIKAVFSGLSLQDFQDSTKATYSSLDYCVQYRESDFNFVSRLMEENGIYYYFTHEDGKHTMVLADDSTSSNALPGTSAYPLDMEYTANTDDVITGWLAEKELRTGKYTVNDYNYLTPSTSLLQTANTIDSIGGNSSYETYDYPGKFLTSNQGQSLSNLRMQEEESVFQIFNGSSNVRGLSTGYKITLQQHYLDSMNADYFLTDVVHTAHTDTYGTSGGLQGDHYSNSFRCIPSGVHYRPLRLTPRPTIPGPQPALVVGPSGEEIYTDKYGRIKVQFYWDRLGKRNETSSCWIRVAQIWAGATWGALFLPRIGQEVMVDFLEGDPDQPLVTGSVYNASMMPPGDLPGTMNLSGIRTRSTKGGGDHDASLIAFDDTKGSEKVYLTAQKDMSFWAKNNEAHTVKNNQTIDITNNRTETIEQGNESVSIKQGTRTHTVSGDDSLTVQQGNRSVTVSTGKDTLTVSTGDRVVTVSTGNDSHTVSMGNRSVTVSMGNDSLTVSLGNHSINVSAGSSSTTAMQSITLTCGGSSITISPTSISLSAPTIAISGDAEVDVSGAMVSVEADGMLSLSGAMTSINS
jgi:type VI secretion system secreted protein VgrG